MLPKYIHLFVVMAMIVAVVVVILLLLGDAAPKQKSYAGARVNFHYSYAQSTCKISTATANR